MNQNPLVATDMQGSRVNETDTGTAPRQDSLDENGRRKQYFLLQFYETVIRHQTWKKVSQMFVHMLLVIMLETAETTGMEQDENNHHLCITHAVGLVAMFGLPVYNHIFFLLQCKFLAKIIGHTINFCNFGR